MDVLQEFLNDEKRDNNDMLWSRLGLAVRGTEETELWESRVARRFATPDLCLRSEKARSSILDIAIDFFNMPIPVKNSSTSIRCVICDQACMHAFFLFARKKAEIVLALNTGLPCMHFFIYDIALGVIRQLRLFRRIRPFMSLASVSGHVSKISWGRVL